MFRRRTLVLFQCVSCLFVIVHRTASHPISITSGGRTYVTNNPVVRIYARNETSSPTAISVKQNLFNVTKPEKNLGYKALSYAYIPPLAVQESRRTNRNERNPQDDRRQPAESARNPPPLDYDYPDAFADVRDIGDAQYSKSLIINPKKKKKKKSKSLKGNVKGPKRRKSAATHGHKVHRYPPPLAYEEPRQAENQEYIQYPDTLDSDAGGQGAEAAYPMYDSQADGDTVSVAGQYQAQPSSDYEDEADPDYDDGGYDDDDDDDDDSMESRSRTFVASGTGPIPEDMRAEMEDDVPDQREVAADAFINQREQDADKAIDYYKQQEPE